MKKVLVLVMCLSLMVFFATSLAYATSNLIPAVKVDNGWASVVSYVNTMAAPAGGQVYVHATYQVKNPTNLLDTCLHLDTRSLTTRNDLTTSVIEFANGGLGYVFPATDTIGSAILAPPAVATDPASEGFLVLENYDSADALGADGTLTSEAIVFNLASGFLFSQRALATGHNAHSPAGDVQIDPFFCGTCNYLLGTDAGYAYAVGDNATGGTLTRFMFLPSSIATTTVYTIALNLAGTGEGAELTNSVNLVASDYNARIRLESRMDDAQSYALGVYNRLEQFRSITTANDIVCLAELTPDQLVGVGISSFLVDGGWLNLAPRCRETENGGVTYQICDNSATGTETGDAAMLYKIEFAPGYGFAITPLNQQWYSL